MFINASSFYKYCRILVLKPKDIVTYYTVTFLWSYSVVRWVLRICVRLWFPIFQHLYKNELPTLSFSKVWKSMSKSLGIWFSCLCLAVKWLLCICGCVFSIYITVGFRFDGFWAHTIVMQFSSTFQFLFYSY